MARDLGVSEGRIGLLMTVYAGLVAAVTIPLMAATRHVNRRPLFLATLGFLLAGIVLQATAPNYFVLVAGRVTAAFTHGLFGPSSTQWRHGWPRSGRWAARWLWSHLVQPCPRWSARH